MATNDPKKQSITGNLVANMLTEREDDYTINATYTANRSLKDLCKLAAKGKSKFTATELESAYNDLEEIAKTELFNATTVEFGFTNNSLGVDGSFIGPGAKFDPSYFSFIIPQLADGTYYLEVATQAGTNSKTMVKEVRRNLFPYVLTVGGGEGNRPVIE